MTLDGHRFVVEVADEPDEQQRGLMGVTELADDDGMLFSWGDVKARSFWMKDTLLPLDLVAIADGEVVSIGTMQPCDLTPCPITSTAPANDVIEINAGRAADLGIEVGDRATLDEGPTCSPT